MDCPEGKVCLPGIKVVFDMLAFGLCLNVLFAWSVACIIIGSRGLGR